MKHVVLDIFLVFYAVLVAVAVLDRALVDVLVLVADDTLKIKTTK